MKKCGSRVKTQKGSLEQKEKFQRLMDGANKKWKGNDQTAPEAFMRSSTPSKIEKNLNLLFENTFPKFLGLSWWVLMHVKLPYSKTRKMNLFKMLDFQRIHFSKRPWKRATLFCSTKL